MQIFDRLARGAGVAMIIAGAAHAQDGAPDRKGPALRLEGKAGAQYTSNISVQDLDTNTGEGDWAATFDALVEASGNPTDKLVLRGGYEFSQTLHDEFNAFDLTLHRGYAEAAYDFGPLTAGILGNHAEASLDGEGYLTFSQISPYVSKQFGDTAFVRLAYAATEKTFDGRAERDATSDAVSADVYVFLDGTRRYIALGGKLTDENAASDELDFSGGSARACFVQRFPAFGKQLTFRAGVEYEQRDYDAPTLFISTARRDERVGAELSLEAPVSKHLFIEAMVRHGDNRSNLPSANYDEQVASLKLGVKY